MIDRNPSHAWLWMAITVLYVLSILTVITAASYDSNHEKRIKALEEHSLSLTKACAMDVEVKDISKRVEALEKQP